MEGGAHHDGLRDSLATDIVEARCDMGYSGSTHQVGTFSGRADDLHIGGILKVVYTGDSTVSWSSSLQSIGSRSSVYDSVLEEFPEGHGDTPFDEYLFSSSDGWSIKADYSDFRGHAVSMRLGSQG